MQFVEEFKLSNTSWISSIKEGNCNLRWKFGLDQIKKPAKVLKEILFLK